MSLLIEGMKMPEYEDVYGDGQNKCSYLLMLNVRKDGTASMQFTDIDGGFYQVKEIPTPHGRLIDADELLNDLSVFEGEIGYTESEWVRSIIDNAPTIIEAEVSE